MPACQAGLARRLHAVPHRRARIAGAVGVVQQQHVEALHAAALQAALGGHADVVAIGVLAAQAAVGEAREPFGAFTPALVEVVADRADDAVVIACDARQRAAQRGVGLARAVRVGRDHRVDAAARAQQRLHAFLVERLAEVHEAPAAPRADRRRRRFHAQLHLKPRRRARSQRRFQSPQRVAQQLAVELAGARRRGVPIMRGLRARRLSRRGVRGAVADRRQRRARLLVHAGAQLGQLGDADRQILALLARQLGQRRRIGGLQLDRAVRAAPVVEIAARA